MLPHLRSTPLTLCRCFDGGTAGQKIRCIERDLKQISLGSLTVLPEGTQRTRFHSSNGTSPGLERPGKVSPTHRVSRMAPMPAADDAGCEIRLGTRSPHDLAVRGCESKDI